MSAAMDDLITSRAHDWAVNANNSGDCIRCGAHVGCVADIRSIPRCIPHFESVRSGYRESLEGEA